LAKDWADPEERNFVGEKGMGQKKKRKGQEKGKKFLERVLAHQENG